MSTTTTNENPADNLAFARVGLLEDKISSARSELLEILKEFDCGELLAQHIHKIALDTLFI